MYILDKLVKQIDSLSIEFTLITQENKDLKQQIEQLNDQNDQLKYNNENMLLNIDKVLNIPEKEVEK
jgi:cell division protein FtsB